MSVAFADSAGMRPFSIGGRISAISDALVEMQRMTATDKPMAWLFDVDGTVLLRDPNGRSPYDWDRVHEDGPNRPVVKVIHGLAATGALFIGVSGRNEVCRPATITSLTRHVFYGRAAMAWNTQNLFMRDDARRSMPDDELKEQIYLQNIKPHWEVEGVLDDRDRVVEMWRRNGLTCLQVAKGNF